VETLGADTDRSGRVKVGDDLTVPGHPNVFVIGDLALRIDPRTKTPVPGVAQGAIQMGKYAGRMVAEEIRARQRGEPAPGRKPFVYRDKGSMATIGRHRAVADVFGLRFGGFPAWIIWVFIHIVSLIEFRVRLAVMAEWTWMYFTFGRGVRLIVGEHRVPRPTRLPEDPRWRAETEGAPAPAPAREGHSSKSPS
jgi:NADH dehydrogenase